MLDVRFPERLGRYELLLPIASGGMATVYLARTRGVAGFSRDVAIKLIHPHLLSDAADAAHDLVEEARIAGRIRHPNVVDVLDVADDGPGIYLVMEYIEGETLASILKDAMKRGSPLAVPIALRILSDALTGLSAAHDLRDDEGHALEVVHRDFSPQNILVGTDGVSRLVDFGIAKAASRGGHTATGMVKGKTAYLAPEQALGKPVDRRCDVFAAGVVAWETFAGQRLHAPTEDPLVTMLKITRERPPRIRTVRPDAPPGLDMALAGALELDPANRCATAEELRTRILAAWASREKPADTREVAAHVAALAAPRLAAWKERVQSTVAARVKADEASGRSAQTPAASPDDATAATSAVGTGPRAPSPRTSRLKIAVALAVAAGSVAVAARWTGRLGSPALPVSTSAASPPAPDPERPIAPPSAAPTASATAGGESDAHELTVQADAPVAQVRIGDRVIAIALPAKSVTLALHPDERGRPVSIEVAAVDGRRVRLSPANLEGAPVVASFAQQAPPRSPARAPSRAPATAKPASSFATNPYAQQPPTNK